MSETLEQETPIADGGDIEARARTMGWKSADELRVQPRGGVLSAEEFIRRGEEELPIARERTRNLEKQLQGVQGDLSRATDVLVKMSDRFRTVEERAYARARKELDAERDAAIANADVREVKRLDTEIRELDKSAEPPQAAQDRQQAAINPDVQAWLADGNDWFTRDPELASEAQAMHLALQLTHKNLTVRENLDRVTDRIRRLYPEKFENQRRAAPSAVSPSTPTGGRPRVDPMSFDALPADSRREYEKYSKLLAGKGKPLTKEEWAQAYHED